MKNKSLADIALELLDKYERAENTVIGEFSGNTRHDEKKLKNEINEYREAIKQLIEQQEAHDWDILEQQELDELEA